MSTTCLWVLEEALLVPALSQRRCGGGGGGGGSGAAGAVASAAAGATGAGVAGIG